MAVPILETTAITNKASNGTSQSVTLPSGVAANDIIIIAIAMDGAPTSFNNSGGIDFTEFGLVNEGTVTLVYLWGRAAGGETTQTITWTGSQQGRFMALRISGCITSGSPIDVIGNGVTNGGSTIINVTGFNTGVDDTLVIAAGAVDRDRVDSGDVVTGTGYSDVGTSGSSGGANGAGLLVAEKDMATAGATGIPQFGTWVSDGTAGRQFSLKPAIGANFEVTATTVLTHSNVNPVIKGANRTVAQTHTESDVVDRGGSTFQRIGTTILTHSDAIANIKGAVRIVSQSLTHSESIARVFGVSVTVAQVITHSESVAKIKGAIRTVAQSLTHLEAIVRSHGQDRTATTVLTHAESIARIFGVSRAVSQTLAHSEIVAKIKGFIRIVSQTLTHIDSAVRDVSGAPLQTDEVFSAASLDGSFKPKKVVFGIGNDAFNKFTIIMNVSPQDKVSITRLLSSVYVRPKDVYLEFKQPSAKSKNITKILQPIKVKHTAKGTILKRIYDLTRHKIQLIGKVVDENYTIVPLKYNVTDKDKNRGSLSVNVNADANTRITIISIKSILKALENARRI